MPYFLRHQGDAEPDPTPYAAKRHAMAVYEGTARGLYAYGQTHTATMHIADSLATVAEYPDFVLSLGPRGGIRCGRA
jgi:hypothetical protein